MKHRLFLVLLSALWTGAVQADGLRQEDLDGSLIHAARQGDMTSFNLALDLGANLNAVGRDGGNAVLAAVQGERHQMLRLLLDKGVDPEAVDASGFTPLTMAVLRGSVYDVELLLKAGARPGRRNVLGAEPLHLAVEHGRHDILRRLLRAGAPLDDANADGETPLIVALRVHDGDAFRLLLAQGAAVNVADRSGRSALGWAILEGLEDEALALVERGARGDAVVGGYPPLRLARMMRQQKVEAALAARGAPE